MAIHMFGFDYDCHLALSSVDSSTNQPNMMLLLLIKKKKNFTKDYPTSGYKTPSTVSLLAILNLLLAFEFLLVKLFTFQKPFSESISLDRIRVNYLQKKYKRLKLWSNVFARNADIWFHIRDGETVSVDLVAWSDFAGEKSQHTHIWVNSWCSTCYKIYGHFRS